MIVLILLGVLFVLLLLGVFKIVGTLIGLILFLVVAGLCGAVAEYFLGYRQGMGETLLIGLVGAALGVILRALLGLPAFLSISGVPVVWAIIGSFIVVAILRLSTGRRGLIGRL